MHTLHNARGESLHLGRELGRGGEGVVHELPSHPDWVAKRYHQAPDAAKQQKLRLMAEAIDSPLRNYAAWPEETLHLGENGPVIGFTMQRIEGRLPIHMLYSPAQRRESFPQARFDFLVFVARNIAAAFATLHEHGHVLGDVNQGNVLVGADSRVILIDCDSFQIQVGDALHRCEVGVAHFTPPELQSIASFEDITRTPNHDGFGLALLIFHLLMGGRHPYSGVPLADHIGESLEADIRDFRYAYAKDAAQRLIAPPPKSVPIESLPPAIVALFEQAFTEPGVAARPTPQQWVGALDALRAQLRACAKNPLHVHAGVTGECVWCGLETGRVLLFGERPKPVIARLAPTTRALVVAALESEFAKISLPARIRPPDLGALRPPGSGEASARTAGVIGWTVSTLLGGVAAISGAALGIAALATLGFATVAASVGIPEAAVSVQKRRDRRYASAHAEFMRTQLRFAVMVRDLNDRRGEAATREWRSALADWESFNESEALELAKFTLETGDPLRQLLQRKQIALWVDARLTAVERSRLRSAGIETAADVDNRRLEKLGVPMTEGMRALASWRDELARSYHRQRRLQRADVNEFRRRREVTAAAIEHRLRRALEAMRHAASPDAEPTSAEMEVLAMLTSNLIEQHRVCVGLGGLLPFPNDFQR
jgi:DNA-binding helix-hairpin-helix protein with protein kinase domain